MTGLTGFCLCILHSFPLFLRIPFYKVLDDIKFTEINIPTLHILLPVSATGPFWFFLLPRICQSGLCLLSCLWLPPFLKIPCCVEKVLDQTP